MKAVQAETIKSIETVFKREGNITSNPQVDRKDRLSHLPDQTGQLVNLEAFEDSAVTRLVVLIPDQDVDTVVFAQKLWQLANPNKLTVTLLTIVPNPDYNAAAQRRLSAIAAITRDRRVKVDTVVFQGKSWIQAVRSLSQPHDLIVCHAEQNNRERFSKKQPLAAILFSNFHQPVFVLSGLYTEIKAMRSKWLGQIPYWLILLTIIVGFFFFESRVDQLGSGWMEKTVFALLFIFEVALIWGWNSIMG